MSKLSLQFNMPFENDQQKIFLKNLKELGFSCERVFQDGLYIKWVYYARLPCLSRLSSFNTVDITFSDEVKSDFFSKRVDSVELTLFFKRKDYEI